MHVADIPAGLRVISSLPRLGDVSLLVSSRYGLSRWAALRPERGIRVFCTGPATARLARRLGYAEVYAPEDSSGLEALTPLILAHHPAGIPLYWATTPRHSPVPKPLSTHAREGLTLLFCYEAKPIAKLPETIAAALSALDGLLLYSSQAARCGWELLGQAIPDIQTNNQTFHVFCLSQAIAQAWQEAADSAESLSSKQWRDQCSIHAPRVADRAGLLDAARKTFQHTASRESL
jgi:uroporphyrinogen-III synthase